LFSDSLKSPTLNICIFVFVTDCVTNFTIKWQRRRSCIRRKAHEMICTCSWFCPCLYLVVFIICYW
jgi:uncharacterized membrane protein YidH (DUF202 family)